MTLHHLPEPQHSSARGGAYVFMAAITVLQFAILVELAWWWAVVQMVRSLR